MSATVYEKESAAHVMTESAAHVLGAGTPAQDKNSYQVFIIRRLAGFYDFTRSTATDNPITFFRGKVYSKSSVVDTYILTHAQEHGGPLGNYQPYNHNFVNSAALTITPFNYFPLSTSGDVTAQVGWINPGFKVDDGPFDGLRFQQPNSVIINYTYSDKENTRESLYNYTDINGTYIASFKSVCTFYDEIVYEGTGGFTGTLYAGMATALPIASAFEKNLTDQGFSTVGLAYSFNDVFYYYENQTGNPIDALFTGVGVPHDKYGNTGFLEYDYSSFDGSLRFGINNEVVFGGGPQNPLPPGGNYGILTSNFLVQGYRPGIESSDTVKYASAWYNRGQVDTYSDAAWFGNIQAWIVKMTTPGIVATYLVMNDGSWRLDTLSGLHYPAPYSSYPVANVPPGQGAIPIPSLDKFPTQLFTTDGSGNKQGPIGRITLYIPGVTIATWNGLIPTN